MQTAIYPSFGGLVLGSVTFSSSPGASLVEQVYFNLTDDLIALEDTELVVVALDVSGAPGTSLGETPNTLINIQDDDGECMYNYNRLFHCHREGCILECTKLDIDIKFVA